MSIVITGGSGFIGTNFINNWICNTNEEIINFDNLTYASNYLNKKNDNSKNYKFIEGDICNQALFKEICLKFRPRAVINFAAETHVDRSIKNREIFLKTNVNGTFNLLEAVLSYWKNALKEDISKFRFIQISTDEVYGSLEEFDNLFNENSIYRPNNPYSASKASADHFVRSYFKTFGLPSIVTHCSNNYGPYQSLDKFIPLIIKNCLTNNLIPIYGNGQQIRDWIYVDDHCRALLKILSSGCIGEIYNIGGDNQIRNIEVSKKICYILDQIRPSNEKSIKSYSELIRFVEDRPGHDKRYGIDSKKIQNDLGWNQNFKFEAGIKKTITWYLANIDKLKN